MAADANCLNRGLNSFEMVTRTSSVFIGLGALADR